MCRMLVIACVAIAIFTTSAQAQRGERSNSDPDERRDDRRESDRDDGDNETPLTPGFGVALDRPAVPGFGIDAAEAGGNRSRGVPLEDRYHERVVAYTDQVIERYDRNRSGKLERDEWTSARWRSDPASSDLNKDGVLTREELCERVKSYDEFRGLSATRSGSSEPSGASNNDRAKLDEYAKGLMKRYDKNDNGVLEEDESEGMSSFHRGADANNDDIITRDELAVRLANYGSTASGGENPRRDGQPQEKEEAASGKAYRTAGDRVTGRDNYRARTAIERLPKGLPDWFARNDADGDGQISMPEFAVSWTDDKLSEFAEHDANGDGLITPQECLRERHPQTTAAPAERPRTSRSRGR